jgi:hypothetical protein
METVKKTGVLHSDVKVMKRVVTLLLIVSSATLGLTVVSAQADMYNLTGSRVDGVAPHNQVTINGAWFYNCNAASTGTGVIDSFVRIQQKGIEEGYNTDGRPVRYQENTSPEFTRSLLLSEVPVVDIGGTEYREFLLDINQKDRHPLLSLDALQIYQAEVGNLTCRVSSLGTPIYTLGSGSHGANWILLDYSLNNGSGSGDMFAYIPDSLFGSKQYVYLYSKFGCHEPANDGFEEWAVRKPENPVVPVPASIILGVLGLSAAGWKLRRFA